MKPTVKPIMQACAGVLLLVLLGACANTSTNFGENSAVAANIMAHRLATGDLPVSAERMGLAVRRYSKNESEPPAQMHTTDSIKEE